LAGVLSRQGCDRVSSSDEKATSKYRSFFEEAPVMLHSLDREGRFADVNRRWLEVLGYRREQVVGQPADAILTSESARHARDEVLPRLWETGAVQDERYRLRSADGREHDVRVSCRRVLDEHGSEVTISLVVDVSAEDQALADLRRREDILEAIAFAATAFLRGGSWSAEVHATLEHVGRAAEASRSYLFRLDTPAGVVSQLAEWCAPGIEPQIDNPDLQSLDLEAAGFGRWLDELRAGRTVHGAISEFPASERELLEGQQIRSLLITPVLAGGQLWGFLGFDDCLADRRWSRTETDSLTTAASLLGAAIERDSATDALRSSEERFRVLVENIPGVVYLCRNDPTYSMIYLSSDVEGLVGHGADRFLDGTLSFVDLYHPNDAEGVVAEVERAIAVRRGYRLRYRLRHASGDWRWIEEHGQGVYDAEGRLLFLEGTMFDITDRTRTEAELQHQALHDGLTGLPNRALFRDRTQGALQRLRRLPEDLFALIVVDIDRFKVINDSLGPGIGDRLLTALGQRLSACVETGDTVARLGGDEFGLLLEGLDEPSQALRVVDRLHRALASPIQIGSHEVFCSASIGIALSHPRYEAPEEMLRDADTAMYRAKASGPGRHVVFDPLMHRRALERLELESDLRRAFDRDELELHYQPILDLASHQIVSVEALVRWNHPTRGCLKPDAFLAVAREAGLMTRIASFVIHRACDEIAELRRGGFPDLGLNVNLDPTDLEWPELPATVARALDRAGLDPQVVTLEITEHAVMRESPTTSSILGKLRNLGIAIGIDDFGTGYSSLAVLQELPINVIKLDRAFLARGAATRPIVAAVAGLARALGLRTTGEGVETQEQLETLRELQYTRAQGYHIAHPAAPEGLRALLQARRAS
jgi:diguanylate cyclase (GGDEF)-like protein/PAS domain S-box-containing protein